MWAECFSEPPKTILTLVPKVSADRQGGAAEPASPRFLVDVAVSRRQKTGALFAGELALSGTHAHTAVRTVRLLKLQGRAGPVAKEDVLTGVKEVRLTFPRRPKEAFPVCFVENSDDSAPASYKPVAGNIVDLQTLSGHGNVVGSDVEGWGSGGMVVEDVLR